MTAKRILLLLILIGFVPLVYPASQEDCDAQDGWGSYETKECDISGYYFIAAEYRDFELNIDGECILIHDKIHLKNWTIQPCYTTQLGGLYRALSSCRVSVDVRIRNEGNKDNLKTSVYMDGNYVGYRTVDAGKGKYLTDIKVDGQEDHTVRCKATDGTDDTDKHYVPCTSPPLFYCKVGCDVECGEDFECDDGDPYTEDRCMHPHNCNSECQSSTYCGNGRCDGDESCNSCPADCDCGPYCGDGHCDPGEDCSCSDCSCSSGYSCVSGSCVKDCQYDCRSSCSDDDEPPYCYERDQKSGYCTGGKICCREEEVSCGCMVPDGSSADCDCNSNTDCPNEYFCNQVSGYDACQPVKYNDDCSNYNDYFCNDGDVYKCSSNGKYYEKRLVEACGKGKFCDDLAVDGTWKCSKLPNDFEVWIDDAGSAIPVNKQPGDKLRLNFYSRIDDEIEISYDPSIFDGNCLGTYDVKSGKNTCILSVRADRELSTEIKVGRKSSRVNILKHPRFLIITDSEQLNKRFKDEQNGVSALLSNAYIHARDKGVVYDLSDYPLGTSPFDSLSAYHEGVSKPRMLDNSYASSISEFVKSRCNGCQDIIMLGDDFVIPYYRNPVPVLEKNLFLADKRVESIYTDSRNIPSSVLRWDQYYELFKVDDKYEGKDILFILPNNADKDVLEQVERIKGSLSKYEPDFEVMDGKSVYCVDERWFTKVRGRTLIIIGTEADNNAFKCMPFVSGSENRDAVFIQPNVWDNREYTIVLNTEDPLVMKGFADLVANEDIVNLKSEGAYFFKVGTQYTGYGALVLAAGALVAGSSTVTIPAAAIVSIAGIADAISDSSSILDSCFVNKEGWGWCGVSSGFAVVPFVSGGPAKNFLKKISESDIVRKLGSSAGVVNDNLNKLFKNFEIDDVSKVIKKEEDFIDLARGQQVLGAADDAISKFKSLYSDTAEGSVHALNTLKRIGATASEYESKQWTRANINFGVMRGVNIGKLDPPNVFSKEGLVPLDYDLNMRDISAHIGQSMPTAFVSGTFSEQQAKRFATSGKTKEGFVYFINPRSGMGIDAMEYSKKIGRWDDVQVYWHEMEVSFPDFVAKEDIIGAWKVDKDGNFLGSFLKNEDTYLGEIEADMKKLFKIEV